jgi:hypothetical protein
MVFAPACADVPYVEGFEQIYARWMIAFVFWGSSAAASTGLTN